MLFMEGTPGEPKSWNSEVVVDVLRNENVTFGSFDLQADEELCDGLKKSSMWSTFLDFIFYTAMPVSLIVNSMKLVIIKLK